MISTPNTSLFRSPRSRNEALSTQATMTKINVPYVKSYGVILLIQEEGEVKERGKGRRGAREGGGVGNADGVIDEK